MLIRDEILGVASGMYVTVLWIERFVYFPKVNRIKPTTDLKLRRVLKHSVHQA